MHRRRFAKNLSVSVWFAFAGKSSNPRAKLTDYQPGRAQSCLRPDKFWTLPWHRKKEPRAGPGLQEGKPSLGGVG
jgi:hypothetical protein